MEIYHEVQTLLVNMQCDTCKNGNMQQTRREVLSNPPSYEHRCDNPACGNIHWFRGMAYPQLRQICEPLPMNPQPVFEPYSGKPSVPLVDTNLNKL